MRYISQHLKASHATPTAQRGAQTTLFTPSTELLSAQVNVPASNPLHTYPRHLIPRETCLTSAPKFAHIRGSQKNPLLCFNNPGLAPTQAACPLPSSPFRTSEQLDGNIPQCNVGTLRTPVPVFKRLESALAVPTIPSQATTCLCLPPLTCHGPCSHPHEECTAPECISGAFILPALVALIATVPTAPLTPRHDSSVRSWGPLTHLPSSP